MGAGMKSKGGSLAFVLGVGVALKRSPALVSQRRSVVRRRGLTIRAHGEAIWETSGGCGCGSTVKVLQTQETDKHQHQHPAHDHDHPHAHEHVHAHDRKENSIAKLFRVWIDRILHFREDMNIIYVSIAFLVLGGMIQYLNGPRILMNACTAGVLALAGLPNLIQSALILRSGKSNIDVLMTFAALASIFTGAVLEGSLLLVLFALSHAAEHKITDKAKGDLDAIKDLSPETAIRVDRDGQKQKMVEVPVDEVVVKDHLLVKAGEVLPCDGVVQQGRAYVNMSHLTGESNPRSIGPGDELPAGARPIDGSITVEVLRTGAESTLAAIIKLVTASRKNRPQLQRFIDRFGENYSKAVLLVSLMIATLLPVVGAMVSIVPPVSYFGATGSISRALGVLVAASPCALVLGAPVAYLSALSACAGSGVLVKGGARTIEAAAGIKQVVFDKTGTLTTGHLSYVGTDTFSESTTATRRETGHRERERHAIATGAALEQHVVHPIANALIAEAESQGIPLAHVETASSFPGEGLEGIVDGSDAEDRSSVRIGKSSFVEARTRDPAVALWVATQSQQAMERGEIVAAMSSADGDAAIFRFHDVVRPGSKSVVTSLRRKLKVSMLTGDREATANAVAAEVGGLDDVQYELSPEDKLNLLYNWKEDGGVLMVGDGVNDAPALAGATVGCAMGLSSATAVHYADVVIVNSDIESVRWFMRKCSSAQNIALQNLFLAIGIMLVGSLLASTGAVPLWLAVSMHEGGTLLVGFNGLRLLSDRLS